MHFEGKHKQFKNAAQRTSYRNILKTVTEYHQRLMAFNIGYDDKFASINFTAGPCMRVLFEIL